MSDRLPAFTVPVALLAAGGGALAELETTARLDHVDHDGTARYVVVVPTTWALDAAAHHLDVRVGPFTQDALEAGLRAGDTIHVRFGGVPA